jgi:hypothetical protein
VVIAGDGMQALMEFAHVLLRGIAPLPTGDGLHEDPYAPVAAVLESPQLIKRFFPFLCELLRWFLPHEQAVIAGSDAEDSET